MDFTTMLQNATDQEQQIINEIARLERMRWALRGQIELLQALIAQQQETPETLDLSPVSEEA